MNLANLWPLFALCVFALFLQLLSLRRTRKHRENPLMALIADVLAKIDALETSAAALEDRIANLPVPAATPAQLDGVAGRIAAVQATLDATLTSESQEVWVEFARLVRDLAVPVVSSLVCSAVCVVTLGAGRTYVSAAVADQKFTEMASRQDKAESEVKTVKDKLDVIVESTVKIRESVARIEGKLDGAAKPEGR